VARGWHQRNESFASKSRSLEDWHDAASVRGASTAGWRLPPLGEIASCCVEWVARVEGAEYSVEAIPAEGQFVFRTIGRSEPRD